MKKKLVMIGNGMAGVRAIEEILKANPDMFEITIFGAEKYPNYNRIMLSPVLAGDTTVEDIILNEEQWYADNNITLHMGKRIKEIQRGYKKVIAEDGTEAEYDNLIIATGSNPFIIPIPGYEKEGVMGFRDIDDCDAMFEAAKKYNKAAVIGGGLLGLEAAKGLMHLGMEATVIHDQATLMNMQLDSVAGEMLRADLEGQGMKFKVSTLTTEITGEERVEGLKFKDGSSLDCDLLVMAAGIRPNMGLASESGIYCNRGIVVNDYMQTVTDPSIYSVGECAEHRGIAYGLVAPLFEQAKILAYQITGQGLKSYAGSEVSTKLKISGVDVFSAGDFMGGPGADIIELMDKVGGVYKKIVLEDDRIKGVVMFGDTGDGPTFFQWMQDGKDVSELRSTLLFSASGLGDSGHSGIDQATAMADDTIVCGCNGVSKKDVVDAIVKEGLTTRKEVTACTKAAGSCGGCAGLIDQILVSTLGTAFVESEHEPICGCTELNHEQVKEQIRNKKLTMVREVMSVLDWKEEGCQVCRPALNYYIGMIWPEDSEDDRTSRIANEKMHANIQKDGTYSVIPRVYGGDTDADTLIRMGQVAKKYDVKTIKITGGQRIGLYGIKKDDLASVWRDLDMPCGYAYGKALRTVKTCVGSEWCRFGTQDSTSLGIHLEKQLDRIWFPAKVKLAVSGCPRNCAEATIKDFGIIGVDGGWEIQTGGNGGVHVEATELLCLVETADEVEQIAKAYLQHYRETGRHNERCAPWQRRVGLESIKALVVDDLESRKTLAERLDIYLAGQARDPWLERIADDAAMPEQKVFNEYRTIEIKEIH
ncbi:nitrite reductase (NADH) large subunit [Mariprofundus micogutta]|uniref:Nitrite reductase (NADH) large subunit n=1 Tax=Mariprofundus micogutta TaxID=1921010 RepID=A0A1L8CQD0_9PROT|nr:nitrite reductase large subunit NirB [Mariprofundus micogutta]GAV21130.1 nitrite reductase (NADH) large subunit [Mariprofundus micogutta]